MLQAPWNNEFIADLHIKLLKAIEHFGNQEYAAIFIPEGEALAITDAIDAHIAYLSKAKCKAIAVDLSRCKTPNATKQMFSHIYLKAKMPHAFFNHSSEAQAWLKIKHLN